MEYPETLKEISEIILSELNNFDRNKQTTTMIKTDVFANPSTPQAVSFLRRLRNIVSESQQQRQKSPFTAYVKAEINGKETILFICKGYIPSFSSITPSSTFVNYLSDIGRAAEKRVGSEFTLQRELKRGKLIEKKQTHIKILEKNQFTPTKQVDVWDAIKNQFFVESGTYSIKSLLKFLEKFQSLLEAQKGIEKVKNILELEKKIFQQHAKELDIKTGLRREVVEKIFLREQGILDEAQGEIFRIPLASQLIVTGAPGTGKTTLLIRRIAQKSNPDVLTEREKAGLSSQEISIFFNKQNWIMFTPTELLKMFLKEALGKEGVPATDETVKIWEHERRKIGRETLKFLKVGDKGFFQETLRQLLATKSNLHLMTYANDFIQFYHDSILKEFSQAYKTLTKHKITLQLMQKFTEIHQKLDTLQAQSLENRIFFLLEALSNLRNLSSQNNSVLNEQIEAIVNEIIKTKPDLLQEIYDKMQFYKADAQKSKELKKREIEENIEEEVEEEDIEEEEIQEEPPTDEFEVLAKRQIRNTLIWYARRIATNQKISQNNIHATILPLISPLFPEQTKLNSLGKRIIDQKVVRGLIQGYRIILDRIPRYYHQFRLEQIRQEESLLDKQHIKAIKDKKLSTHEIDLLLFVILRNARKIFDRNKDLLTGNAKIEMLENIKTKYKTQIAVDEATDFSTLQLGCMYYLTHPTYTSISFAGDLMQRVTPFGLTDWKELEFIAKFEYHRVNIAYRQSPLLLKIAEKLYEKIVGESAPFKSAFDDSEADPYPLKFHSDYDNELLGEWVAERVVEIYKINDKLPSTAIFVADDEQIAPIVKVLEEPLYNNSITVRACPKGEILGNESTIRVFSIKYIKGLEFESVFFVNIDQIAQQVPELIDKYLYVGLSRAASFLAVTYNTTFPEKIKFVEESFKEGNWSEFI